MSNDFSSEQKRYLEGMAAGMAVVKAVEGARASTVPALAPPSGPDAEHVIAQDKATAGGGKLVDQEKWKRAEHPFDAHARLKREAESGKAPAPQDNFRWRYHGLFYVAPAQTSYMARLRIPNGILNASQFEGVADLAERFGGGYAHVTTRANLQVREIAPENGPAFLEGVADLGLTARGAGADNIRNVTGAATAGIDPQELLDTRPLCRAWHFHILNDRSLYGLPRKFNVSFDGGGVIPSLEETNDIAFQAVEVKPGAAVAPGVWMRLGLGGITGHRDLARGTGVVVAPKDCVAVADAVVRVFIAEGDRTNRGKARLKYVLDRLEIDGFLARVETVLGRTLDRVEDIHVAPRPETDRFAHVGVHKQKQAGKVWVGLVLPVGRMSIAEMRVIAAAARRYGDGDIRLTVWQNLILSGVSETAVPALESDLAASGIGLRATSVRAGLVACTGATGCKFAASHTKEDALVIADHVESRLPLDVPVNIHLTGCHHSCAQHYIGDIGLIGARVPVGTEGDTVDGYDIVVGGGFAENAAIGREVWKGIAATDAAGRVEALLRAYMGSRDGPGESFQAFATRVGPERIAALALEPEMAS